MDPIWMAIAPSSNAWRVLATRGPGDTLMKGRLSPRPRHPRAIPALVEALALWEGRPVRAVLAVDDASPSFATSPCLDIAGSDVSPLYTLELVPTASRPRRRELTGMGNFRDLHRLLHTEVAR